MLKEYSIIKIIPYFGSWPEWFHLYLETCRCNPDIDWFFIGDCPTPDNPPSNTYFINISFEKYCEFVSERLGIHFKPSDPYKLCDLKPALGFIHEEQIRDYDFFAFGDIDIVYGQIRKFLTRDILEKYNVISTHSRRLSGHFSIFRNTEKNRNAFRKIPRWRQLLESDKHLSVDESKFTKVFLPHKKHPEFLKKLWSLTSSYQRNVLFKEQYSTILSPIKWVDGGDEHPQFWQWKNGRLFNTNDCRDFMYLHFMNWKSSKWLPRGMRGQSAAWEGLRRIVRVDYQEAVKEGFQISPAGFTQIDEN
jgi:hypothetical protein